MPDPRILFVSDHLGHSHGRIHGATRYFLSVLPRLQQTGFSVRAVFLRGPHPLASELQNAGVDTTFLNKAKADFFAFLPLKRILNETGADILHASGLKGMLMARSAVGPQPLLLHLHDMISVRPAFAAPLLGAAFQRADRILCVSDAVREFGRDQLRLPEHKLVTLRNGVPLPVVSETDHNSVREEFGLSSESRIFLHIGRLDDTKNPFAVLEAFVGVTEKSFSAVLFLIGEGELKTELKRKVQELGLQDRVFLTGQREDLESFLAVAYAMLCAPRSEGLGLAALEALASGCPVLATRTGGLTEVVQDGVNGRLLPHGSPEALSVAALELLADPDKQHVFSKAARESAREFDIDLHVQRLGKIYREVLA